MRDYGRFTFLLKYFPEPPYRKQKVMSFDGSLDITIMGEEWGHFWGEEDDDEDALIVKKVYELTFE